MRPHPLSAPGLALLGWLSGCGAPAPCPECPSCPPAPAAGATLGEWEARVAAEDLADLRAGVRPLADGSFGVCSGSRRCDTVLGPSPGELPPGDYILHAELRVPRIGQGWKARFAVECQISSPSGTSTTRQDKVYDLAWSSDPARGYRLSPLWTLRSPHKDGARSCTYTLTPIRPDGSEQEPLSGAFSTPAPG